MAVGEAWTRTPESTARYVRPDELHQAFAFRWLRAPFAAPDLARVIEELTTALGAVGSVPTWVLSNHDVKRHRARYGGGEIGLARATAATLVTLALPGSTYLYQGEELGLPDVDVAPEDRQDPSWFRTGQPGRDGCRVPIPWGGTEPPYEFGPGEGQPWIPQPPEWGSLSATAQAGDPHSTLELYRRALAVRRTLDLGSPLEGLEVDGDVLRFRRGDVAVVLNTGETGVPLPDGEVILASSPVDGSLPPNTTVWIR